MLHEQRSEKGDRWEFPFESHGTDPLRLIGKVELSRESPFSALCPFKNRPDSFVIQSERTILIQFDERKAEN
jgi:hypothetical protein